MTKSFAVLAGLAVSAAAVFNGVEAAGQKSASLQGVWQAVEVKFTGPAARTLAIPEPRPNLIILTARHYSRVTVESEGPRPVLADVTKATADELRAAWGPFAAEAGTYELTGAGEIVMRPIAARNPTAMAPGAFTSYSLKMDGNTIWVTQQRNEKGPFANPVTIKAVRIE